MGEPPHSELPHGQPPPTLPTTLDAGELARDMLEMAAGVAAAADENEVVAAGELDEGESDLHGDATGCENPQPDVARGGDDPGPVD